ncbi:hypothetical protein AVP42_00056 [Agromyces sp. NDB4Y10]|uniref:hypothetical protein n=1 Tax=Agromyces sp. NDB4Y10 TaxID=1775951 RepID=UPI0007B2D9C9|nr:hypothetical protein [Agromyces sp. NDB4Y10]KZE95782.1 hypothetical protein AVP42_00056 [Agromyces sp. NDB4Y10]
MSSESPVAGAAESPPASARFTRLVLAIVAVLAVLVVGLGAANALRGPRVLDTVAGLGDATRLAGTTIEFRLNQPVADLDASAVRVDPATDATVSVDDRTVRVAFAAPLRPSQDYVVEVAGVRAVGGGPESALRHEFRTADEVLHVLQRRADGDDTVVRVATGGGEPEVVLAAPRIESFAHAGDVIAAIELLDDGANALRIAAAGQEGPPASLALPQSGDVRNLQASTTRPLLGFVQDGAGGFATLHVLDVADGVTATPQPVLGLDGSPMSVDDYAFVPGTSSLVVRDRDGAMFLVDAAGVRPSTPLGSHTELRGILPGTSTVVVADPDRGATIDLATGETSTLELPPADLPDGAYPGRVTSLDLAGAHLLNVLIFDGSDGGQASLVARADADGTSVVFAPAEGSAVLDHCLAPGGTLVAVETGAVGAPNDGYEDEPWVADTITTLVEVDTGRIVLSLAGGRSDWCG